MIHGDINVRCKVRVYMCRSHLKMRFNAYKCNAPSVCACIIHFMPFINLSTSIVIYLWIQRVTERERERQRERKGGGIIVLFNDGVRIAPLLSQNLYARYARRENSIINVEKTNIASRARRSIPQMLNCAALAIWFFSLFPRRSFKQLIPSLAKFLRSDERASKSYAVVMHNCCKTEFAV